MKRLLITSLLLLSSSAFAIGLGNDNPGSTVLSTNVNTPTNISTNINTPTAIAGAVSGSYAGANSDSYARAQAQQSQYQAQAQRQQQQQGNIQGTSVGGQVATVGGQTSTVGGQVATVGGQTSSTSVGGQTSSTSVGGQTTTFTSPSEVRSIQDGTTTIRTVPHASAPAALPTAPCRISHSAGLALVGVGVSGGTSTEDEGCTMRENARILDSLGERTAALLLMCFNEQVAAVLSVCKAK